MSHNCQTILQPPLVPVVRCHVPPRSARNAPLETVELCEVPPAPMTRSHHKPAPKKRNHYTAAVKFIRANPSISQNRIGLHLNVSGATASKVLTRLIDLEKIELVVGRLRENGKPRGKFYKIKEYVQ